MALCLIMRESLPRSRRAFGGLRSARLGLGVAMASVLAGVISAGMASAQQTIREADIPPQTLVQLIDQGVGPRRSLRPQPAVPPDSVVLLDRQRLYEGSELGKASLAILDEKSRELIAENRQLEATLEEEERQLTQRRAQVSVQEFRKLADDFDRRVQDRRQAQDGKTRALARARDEARQHFFTSAVPILGQLMQDIGAVAILDQAAVILSFERIDITDKAIERLDDAYRAGSIAVGPPAEDPLDESGGGSASGGSAGSGSAGGDAGASGPASPDPAARAP